MPSLQRVAAGELGVADEELEARLERVLLLLPDLRSKLASMRVQVLARLAADVEVLPPRLLRLKHIFPGCNASLLAMRQPELVLGLDLDRIEAAAQELRAMLPTLDVGKGGCARCLSPTTPCVAAPGMSGKTGQEGAHQRSLATGPPCRPQTGWWNTTLQY